MVSFGPQSSLLSEAADTGRDGITPLTQDPGLARGVDRTGKIPGLRKLRFYLKPDIFNQRDLKGHIYN